MKRSPYKGTKVLVMGLGLHGGGVATARWFAMRGALVTATDLRSKEVLKPSLQKLKGLPITYVLGEHREEDFRTNEIIVVNPGVPRESRYLAIAKKAKRQIINDAALFFREVKGEVIGVTGTRGKTTTTSWIAELLRRHDPRVLPCGNTPQNAFLNELLRVEGTKTPIVAELSSWQLEHLPQTKRAPHIAVITNLYPDHLNRYEGMNAYANAKAGIFANQTEKDYLILNRDNEWCAFFAKKKRHSKLLYATTAILPERYDGIFVRHHHAVIRVNGKEHVGPSLEKFRAQYGVHNLSNVLLALLAIYLYDRTIVITEKELLKLRAPNMRQEIVKKWGDAIVVNDSCATSPDGVIAAIERFLARGSVVLITGGTDKELNYQELANCIATHRANIKLILLEGSGTTKLIQALKERTLDIPKTHATLESCVEEGLALMRSSHAPTLLFSPGGSSFEKFLHEFDRGEQFNALIKKLA